VIADTSAHGPPNVSDLAHPSVPNCSLKTNAEDLRLGLGCTPPVGRDRLCGCGLRAAIGLSNGTRLRSLSAQRLSWLDSVSGGCVVASPEGDTRSHLSNLRTLSRPSDGRRGRRQQHLRSHSYIAAMSDRPLSSFRREVAAGVWAAHHGIELAESKVGIADVSAKKGRDIVTASDVAIGELVRSLLSESLGQAVVGEEHGGARPSDGSAYWLVDPICGTRNYASGMSLYCLNLAFVQGDEVIAAVVADPSTSEIVIAERDRGAWLLKGDELHSIKTSAISQMIVVEDGKAKGAPRDHAAAFSAAVIRADRWDFRSLGTTLSLPYLAAGRIAAYVLFSISAVHSAAGSLLVTEAGGVLSDVDGQPWTIDSPTMLASANQVVHNDLLELATLA
jgi:myo-inositol-1(or 4)-monophosphatase